MPDRKSMSVTDEYQMVLNKFQDFERHGHLQLRFSLSNPETVEKLKNEGYRLTHVEVQKNLVFDIVAPEKKV